ncbi:flavoprotein [Streptomyces lunaelactis]|uniref:flavoprotein n=1 Tax=Streptomyces lunaelactis TaxID=1535768 RepID=UPI0015846A7E|nr:flavoprotein [Streptomyces lunaelactis]NUK32251.1 flavoprotein [Streptomyces lunaelactis]NUK41259.1 flavoprotein [Streptomyces lunaelactis]
MRLVQGKVLGVVGSGAGGVEELRTGLVVPALECGWTVAVTLTPTAGEWLRSSGEAARIEELTGLPVRTESRLPGDSRPHPPVDGYVVAPASANTVAKLAMGISDNQALTQVNEAIGTLDLPVVVWPRVNAAHARHPAWEGHIKALHNAGVRLIYGDEVWPLAEPRVGMPGRRYPWEAVLDEAGKTSI